MESPQELQKRLRILITACNGPDRPSRQKLASELRRLADEVMVREAKKDLSKLPGFEVLKGLSKAEQEEILFRALADNAAESRRLKKKIEETAKGLHKKLREDK